MLKSGARTRLRLLLPRADADRLKPGASKLGIKPWDNLLESIGTHRDAELSHLPLTL